MFGSDTTCRITMSFYLVPEEERNTSAEQSSSSMRSVLSETPGIRYAIRTGDPIRNEFPIQINLFGSNLDILKTMGIL